MISRTILAVIGLFEVSNGTYMMFRSREWFESAATGTGGYNAHFVQDVGAAFIVSGVALLAGAWRPRYWPAALTGAAFPGAHGLIHVAGMFPEHSHHIVRDFWGILMPAALVLWAAWRGRETNA